MNAWLIHVKKFREANPHLTYKECLQQAKHTYPQSKKQGGDLIRDTNRAFRELGRKMDRINRRNLHGINRVGEKFDIYKNKGVRNLGSNLGQITNDELLPITQQVGTEVYKKALNILDPFTLGNASRAGNMLYDKMAKKYIRQPKSKIGKVVSESGKVAVDLYPVKSSSG